jgi:cytidine deaminase
MGQPTEFLLRLVRHDNSALLDEGDRALVEAARVAALKAYAPYSRFQVGAALRTADGTVVIGSNQENASFPAGICAERAALHAAMSQWPQAMVSVMAIVVPSIKGDRPVTPCGICRQALAEQEMRQAAPVRLLMAIVDGPVYEVERAGDLLPFSFDASFLEG